MTDLRHFRHALALAEFRNFARAADALHITQPALTRSIQALEDALGVRLFDRGPRGVEPTDFGEMLIRHAQSIELQTRDLNRELQLAKGLEVGTLNIGVGPWGAASMVGAVIGQLSRLYPRLRTRVLITPWQELPNRIRRREVDLMVSDVSEAVGKDDLDVTPLSAHPSVVVCRPDHPLTRRDPIRVVDLFGFPIAAPSLPQHAADRLLEQAPAELRERIRAGGMLAVTCDSSSMLKAVLVNSDAVSMMSLFMVIDELNAGELAVLRGLDLGIQGNFGVTHLRGRSLSAPGEAFLKLLTDHDRLLAERESALIGASRHP